jgi:hypothetical protein
MTPAIESLSCSSRATASLKAFCHAAVMVFTAAPGASKVRVTTRSSPFSKRTGIYRRSTIVAMPMPPPTHSVARP